MSTEHTITMRMPNGRQSKIRIAAVAKGIDLHFERSGEGELLVMLSDKTAGDVAAAINAVIATRKANGGPS